MPGDSRAIHIARCELQFWWWVDTVSFRCGHMLSVETFPSYHAMGIQVRWTVRRYPVGLLESEWARHLELDDRGLVLEDGDGDDG